MKLFYLFSLLGANANSIHSDFNDAMASNQTDIDIGKFIMPKVNSICILKANSEHKDDIMLLMVRPEQRYARSYVYKWPFYGNHSYNQGT